MTKRKAEEDSISEIGIKHPRRGIASCNSRGNNIHNQVSANSSSTAPPATQNPLMKQNANRKPSTPRKPPNPRKPPTPRKAVNTGRVPDPRTEEELRLIFEKLSGPDPPTRIKLNGFFVSIKEVFKKDTEAPFGVRLCDGNLAYIPIPGIGDKADLLLQAKVQEFYSTHEDHKHMTHETQVAAFQDFLLGTCKWHVADFEHCVQQYIRTENNFATSSDLNALVGIVGIVGTVATQLKQSDSSTKEQIATLALRMQESGDKSARNVDTFARNMDTFATTIETAMKDFNKRFEAIGQNILDLTKAVSAHDDMLQKLKVDTANHASTIVDHAGKIQSVQAVQEQIMEEQQRVKSIMKSMLQSKEKSARNIDTFATTTDTFTTTIKTAMKDSNERFESIGQNILDLANAALAHDDMLQKLKIDTANHASTIVDHAGKIQSVQAVQEQIMEEQQRVKSIMKSMLQSTDGDAALKFQEGDSSEDASPLKVLEDSVGISKLSKDEINFCEKFIKNYTIGSRRIDSGLRLPVISEKCESDIQKFVQTLPHFLSEPYVKTVYRGASHYDGFIENIKTLLSDPQKHGRVFYQDSGFLSTSFTKFSEQTRKDYRAKNTHFVIESLTGRCVKDYAASAFQEEDEVLFLPCTRFEITKCETATDGKHVIYMHEVPQS